MPRKKIATKKKRVKDSEELIIDTKALVLAFATLIDDIERTLNGNNNPNNDKKVRERED